MKTVLTSLALFFIAAGIAAAQRSGTGIGGIVGEPTGFSVKHWVDDRSAIDGAVGLGFDAGSSLHLHADWLWHDFSLFPVARGALPIHYGVGARFKSSSDNRSRGRGSDDRFGARAPVGISYHFDDRPLELFAELAPILDVAPSTRLSINAAVGVRWYFR